MWRQRALAGLAVAAAAALAAGCGGGASRLTKAQYEQRVQADAKALEQAVAGIGTSASSLAALKTAVATAETGVEKAADDLDSLKPPKEAEEANAAFVTALRAIDEQLVTLKQAVDRGDMSAVLAAVQGLSSSKEIAAAQAAAKQLTKLGYDLGALGS